MCTNDPHAFTAAAVRRPSPGPDLSISPGREKGFQEAETAARINRHERTAKPRIVISMKALRLPTLGAGRGTPTCVVGPWRDLAWVCRRGSSGPESAGWFQLRDHAFHVTHSPLIVSCSSIVIALIVLTLLERVIVYCDFIPRSYISIGIIVIRYVVCVWRLRVIQIPTDCHMTEIAGARHYCPPRNAIWSETFSNSIHVSINGRRSVFWK